MDDKEKLEEFKVGDWVECVSDYTKTETQRPPIKGNKYQINHIATKFIEQANNGTIEEGWLMFMDCNSDNTHSYYSPDGFKKLTPQ